MSNKITSKYCTAYYKIKFHAKFGLKKVLSAVLNENYVSIGIHKNRTCRIQINKCHEFIPDTKFTANFKTSC